VTFPAADLRAIDDAIRTAIVEKQTPGGVLWMEQGTRRYVQAYGNRACEPIPEPATQDTIYDAASLTKVVATTPAVLLLVQRKQLALDMPVMNYWPEFGRGGKETITIRHLLTHTAGLRAGLNQSLEWTGYRAAMDLVCGEIPVDSPGSVFRYSDINFIVLGELVRRVSGQSLDEFAAREIFRPLKMRDTDFNPPTDRLSRIAPTEWWQGTMLHGQVHDPVARRMGGVAGHAGLFTTASDLARYARMMLRLGELDGVRILHPNTVQLMTQVQTPPRLDVRRGLGWDMESDYSHPRGNLFPLGSYGHTGWTGTCLWIDPVSRTFWLLLSNRVHPSGQGHVLALERTLGTLVAQAATRKQSQQTTAPNSRGHEKAPTPNSRDPSEPGPRRSSPVLTGIDVLERDHFLLLRGKRVGLITNQTGRNRKGTSTIDLLFHAPAVHLRALFCPEHGIRGDQDDRVANSVDARTGLPIFSLYGEFRRPRLEQLQNLDVVVFDIQDIGCRFYTYITTLGYAMEAAALAGIPLVVLDRVNPINGKDVDGPVMVGDTSFTAYHAIPIRHGMTVGELARMFREEKGLKVDLTVVAMEHWFRDEWFDQTGLPWIHPSPNMRSLAAAALYPGIGLLETTELSVGRGTDTPFEKIGAPYLDAKLVARRLNQEKLAGVEFSPTRFTPVSSVFKGQTCGGVNIRISDRNRCHSLDVGLIIGRILHQLYPSQFTVDKMNTLLVHPNTISALKAGKSLQEIRTTWEPELRSFHQRRSRYLLYP
jgi:uncharacterized protein YbbC (DUF1343 family)/CubicO group peptidase (beta-lactamase class C family)